MSRGIIVNNPGSVETVVNLTAIKALDDDTIYTGSVWLSNISSDEIDAVRSAIEAYSPTPGPGPGPTPGPTIEPYYVPGWFEHQDGNWVLVKAGQTWEIQYSDNGSSWTNASYTAGDADTWFNMDNEPFRQAKYIIRYAATSSGNNKIIAINLDMPNYVSTNYNSTSSSHYAIFNDPILLNVKIKIDHFEYYSRNMFYGNQQMTTCEIEQYNPELMNVTELQNMFQNCYSLQILKGLENWNVEKVTNMSQMFNGCCSLQSLDLSNWNVEKVTNMSQMFNFCYLLQSLNISNWNTGNVTKVDGTFNNCHSLQSLDLSNWNVEKVTSMEAMVQCCTSLQILKGLENWNVENVTSMASMFYECHSLQSLDLSNWNTGNVTSMASMFYECHSLQSLDLSNWNVEKVTNMSQMFYECASLQSLDLSNWNVEKVTNMSQMFFYCASLQSLDLSNWNVEKVTNVKNIFEYCFSIIELKIKSKPKTLALPFYSSNYIISNDLLQWMADNFPDISGDDTYTNKTISGFSSSVKSRYMWNYFYNTMTAKGYTIS